MRAFSARVFAYIGVQIAYDQRKSAKQGNKPNDYFKPPYETNGFEDREIQAGLKRRISDELKQSPLTVQKKYPLDPAAFEDVVSDPLEEILPGRSSSSEEEAWGRGDRSQQKSEVDSLALAEQLSTASDTPNRSGGDIFEGVQWVQELQYAANSPCEDTIASSHLHQIQAYAISIFDGHGGPQLALFCKDRINLYLDRYIYAHKSNPLIQTVIVEALVWAYQRIQEQFLLQYEKELRRGNNSIRSVGTCAITVVLYKGTAYLANAGDSQAITISRKEGNPSFRVANQRLSTSNPTEKQRIIKLFKDKEESNLLITEGQGVYLKGRLQPTRTIGDYYLKHKKYYTERSPFNGPYLHCKPDIKQIKINPSMKYLVVASDGVWDYLSKKEVTALLMSPPEVNLERRVDREESSVGLILEGILKKCSKNSRREVCEIESMLPGQRRGFHDDITIAVVDLQSMPK